ncbi:MAG: hypothetical protein EON47_09535, partial [Acetobacteraceae bacterium]
MPPKPRPGASQILPGMPDAGWGRFAADARSAARRQGPLQAPLPPVLLASLVGLLDALAIGIAGFALQALPLPAD